MIALVDSNNQIYKLKSDEGGFEFVAIFSTVEDAIQAKSAYRLDDAKLVCVGVKLK